MIINTNLQTPEKQTIDYIRNLAREIAQSQQLQDSLVVSQNESEGLSNRIAMTRKKKKKEKSNSSKYVSPYKQDSIDIRNITNRKNKSPQHLACFTNLALEQQKQKQSIPIIIRPKSITNRYLQSPSFLQKLEKNQFDKMKQEAHIIYQNQRKQKEGMTSDQKRTKWADFLLRQRRWEQGRQNKLMEAKHKAISSQKQFQVHFVARQPLRMDTQDYIRKVKRQKLKLQEKLRQLEPNFYTWKNHKSPNKYRSPKVTQEQNKLKKPSQKRICLSSQKQISFLLNR